MIVDWSNDYHNKNKKITPNSDNLASNDFLKRICGYDIENSSIEATKYPGLKGKLSYSDIFDEVWVQQKWPNLCQALSCTP